MSGRGAYADDAHVLAQAAAWRVSLAEAEADSSIAFEQWLQADARHRAAWTRVNGPWDVLGTQAASPELMKLRRDALHRAHRHERKGKGLQARWAWAAALLVAVVAGGWLWNLNRPDIFRTALGERRVISLEDGSRVSLDSGSELRLRFDAHARRLELRRGQARFDVARDATRPFTVQAGDQRVVATGTAFNVDLLGERVLVTLIEGRVEVLPGQPVQGRARTPLDQTTTTLKAGEQMVVAPRRKPVVAPVDVESATAWESGQLVFRDEPLASVAQRVGRYQDHPIEVEPGIGALRISGVFHAGDLDTFVEVVTLYLPVRAVPREDGGILLRLRN